jgi:hypothetical protein
LYKNGAVVFYGCKACSLIPKDNGISGQSAEKNGRPKREVTGG